MRTRSASLGTVVMTMIPIEMTKKKKLRENLKGLPQKDRYFFPYRNIEDHLKENGFADVYKKYKKYQKTRAAAEVASVMEGKGEAGVTPVIRTVIEKAIGLARRGST